MFGFKGEENESKLDTCNQVIDLFSEVLQENFNEHQIEIYIGLVNVNTIGRY